MSVPVASDPPEKTCGVCYGVLYLTRAMIRQNRGPRCFGYMGPRSEPAPIHTDDEEALPEQLSTLIVIGKASIWSDTHIGGVSGLRFIVISTRDENDVSQDVLDIGWKEAFQRQLDRQRQVAGMLTERMVWQLSSSGLVSLRQQLSTFVPAAHDFAQTYFQKMRSFFSGESPKARD